MVAKVSLVYEEVGGAGSLFFRFFLVCIAVFSVKSTLFTDRPEIINVTAMPALHF
jgi:hypothetical protein